MKRYKMFLCSFVLGAVLSISSPAPAAEVWLENNLTPDPTGDLVPVVVMYVDKVFVGREIVPGNLLRLSDLKPGGTNVTHFKISSGDYEYRVKCPKDDSIEKTLKFTDIRDNKLPEGFSVEKQADEYDD